MSIKVLVIIITISLPLQMMSQTRVFKFSSDFKDNNWTVVNDGVMGGVSNSTIKTNSDGHGVFSGTVRLENNGGFASVRHSVKKVDLSKNSKFVIKVKGDGKMYQFRCKSNLYDRQSYVYEFKTTGDWQEIEIPFAEMYPRFRGNQLNMPNYEGGTLAEVAFLIGNKVKETFQLEIDYINSM